MKITKGIAFLIAHITFTGIFFTLLFCARDYIMSVGVPVIVAMGGNITQFIALQVIDKYNVSKNYVPALDPNNHSQTEINILPAEVEGGK